jgi:16S rRNA (guanine527-N7)-methyltransferase
LGVELDDGQASGLLAYLDLIYQWNRSAGLTSISRPQAVRLHLLDSLSLLELLRGSSELADLGSGAGLPGIPLALARPDLGVVLVEIRERKCSFLAEARRRLGLANVEVARMDAHSLASSGRRFEAVCGRAFLPLPSMATLGLGLLKPGGCLLLMCGPDGNAMGEEIKAANPGSRILQERRLRLPGGTERRCLLKLGPARTCFT